jgi:hypothetical protein
MPSKTTRFPISKRPKRLQRGTRTKIPPRATHALLMFLALLLLPLHIAAAAQSSGEKSLLLSRDEGLVIVQAISEHRRSLHRNGAKPDCSHLVNDIYELAGYPYPFAKSSDLYLGQANFIRVTTPQPGDLIVWRGHVGLVTDPQEHFFYSSLRSGLDIEDYTSPYWRRHGVPRFYRYRITNDHPFLTARRDTGRNEVSDTFRTLQVSQATRDDIREEAPSTESPDLHPHSNGSSVVPHDSNAVDSYSSIPTGILIASGRDKPTIEQVNEAVSRMNQSMFLGLDAESLLRSRSITVIFNQFRVERIVFKGKHAWAFISVDSGASLNGGVLDKTARHDEQRWEMNRAKTGWTLAMPAGNIYVPRAVAVRIFAQQLAHLTDARDPDVSASMTSQESNLAALLNGLLNN